MDTNLQLAKIKEILKKHISDPNDLHRVMEDMKPFVLGESVVGEELHAIKKDLAKLQGRVKTYNNETKNRDFLLFALIVIVVGGFVFWLKKF